MLPWLPSSAHPDVPLRCPFGPVATSSFTKGHAALAPAVRTPGCATAVSGRIRRYLILHQIGMLPWLPSSAHPNEPLRRPAGPVATSSFTKGHAALAPVIRTPGCATAVSGRIRRYLILHQSGMLPWLPSSAHPDVPLRRPVGSVATSSFVNYGCTGYSAAGLSGGYVYEYSDI